MYLFLKRIVLVALVLLMVFPFWTISAQAQRAPAGSTCSVYPERVYRSPVASTVYFVTTECQKRPIFNPDVYFSHFTSWDEVVFLEPWEIERIPDHPLNFLPLGPRREFGNHSLIKTTDDPRVYLILNSMAYPIESEEAFRGFGFTFDQVEDVVPEVLAKFTKRKMPLANLDDTPPSLVFKYPDSPEVYVLENINDRLVKRHVVTMEELNRLARSDRLAILPPTKVFDSGSVTHQISLGPISILNLPEDHATLEGSVTLESDLRSSTSTGGSLKYYIGNAEVGSFDQVNGRGSLEIDTTRFANNDYVLRAVIKDIEGNVYTKTRFITIYNSSNTSSNSSSGGGGGGGGGSSGGSSGGGGGGGGGSSAPQDTTAPTISLTAPEENAVVSDTITLSATASDNVGVTSVSFAIDGTTLASIASGDYQTNLDTSSYEDGEHTITATARDAVGNTTQVVRTITIQNEEATSDITAPTVSFTAPNADATLWETVTVSASASDDSGISYLRFYIGNTVLSTATSSPYSISLDTTEYANGGYILSLAATDTSGNTATATRSVTITNPAPDTTVPTVSFTAPNEGETVSHTMTMTASASDNEGVASVRFLINGTLLTTDTSAPYTTAVNTTLYTNGDYTLSAVVADTSGNMATTTRSITIENTPIDTTAPSVSFSSPSNGAMIGGVTTISVDVSDETALSSVAFYVDGSLQGSPDISYPYSISLDTTGFADGSHTLSAVATDTSDNAATSTISVTFSNAGDTQSPSVSLSSPSNGATLSGSTNLVASATDDIAISSVQFYLGTTSLYTDSSSPYSFSLDTTGYSNGGYVLSAVATDTSGNAATSTITVTISNSGGSQNPTISSLNVVAKSTIATISWNTNVNTTSTIEYGLTTAYGEKEYLYDIESSHEKILLRLIPNTTYHYRIISHDMSGNVSTSQDYTFTTTNTNVAVTPGWTNLVDFIVESDGTYSLGEQEMVVNTARDQGSRITYFDSVNGDNATGDSYWWNGTNLVDTSGSITNPSNGQVYGTDPLNPNEAAIMPLATTDGLSSWPYDLRMRSNNYNVADNFPDWYLYRRGVVHDTFDGHLIGGRSEEAPLVFAAYGPLADGRAIIAPSEGSVDPVAGYLPDDHTVHQFVASLEFRDSGFGGYDVNEREPGEYTAYIEDCYWPTKEGGIFIYPPKYTNLYRSVVSNSFLEGAHNQGYFTGGYTAHTDFNEVIFYRNGYKEDPRIYPDPRRDIFSRNIYQGGGAKMGHQYRNIISAYGASGGPQMRFGGLIENSFIMEGYWFSSTNSSGNSNDWLTTEGTYGTSAIVRNNVQLVYGFPTPNDLDTPYATTSQAGSQPSRGYELLGATFGLDFEGNIISGAMLEDDLGAPAGRAFFQDFQTVAGQTYDDNQRYPQVNNIVHDNIFYRTSHGIVLDGEAGNTSGNIYNNNAIYSTTPIDNSADNLTSANQVLIDNNRFYSDSGSLPTGDWIGSGNTLSSTASAASAEDWTDPDRTIKRYVQEVLGLTLLDWADDPYLDQGIVASLVAPGEEYDPTGIKTFMAVAARMRRGGTESIPTSGKPDPLGDYPWDARFTGQSVVNWIRAGFGMQPVD